MSLIDDMFETYGADAMYKCDYSENYSKENLIKICSNCGGNHFYERVTDSVDYIECEREVLCKKCGDRVNYWAYGTYENDMNSESYKKMLRQKKLERLLWT